MEQKLREYRELRRRKELEREQALNNIKENQCEQEKTEKPKKKFLSFLVPKFLTKMFKEKDKKEEEVLLMEEEEEQHYVDPIPDLEPQYEYEPEQVIEDTELESIEEQNPEPWRYFIIKWTIYTIIWTTGYVFFLSQGFGAVYFAFSVLIGICLNTRTRRKQPGEISAYSVFNRNCESIEGTVKAEELQRQMMFGAVGVGGIRLL